MTKLALRDIECAFGGFTAVTDISLDLRVGEFVSLLGPSGCGKTTTLRMIAGFISPTRGVIEMNGKVLSSPTLCVPPERRHMSMIFQSYAIWPNMTVAENVAFGLRIKRLSNTEIRHKVDHILEVVKMGHLARRYPAELSGGQQQRVALARAVVVEPEVLLLDEPLSNLDANLREAMLFEIRALHDEFKITTVYVTHDQSEAIGASDRIVVMNHGRVEQVADPFTLYNRPDTRFVASFIGSTNLLECRLDGARVEFANSSVDAALFPQSNAVEGSIVLSVRPQNINLHQEVCEQSTESLWVEGRIVKRTYLGERWDYIVKPVHGNQEIRVSTHPTMVVDAGRAVWLEIDPKATTHVR